MHVVDRSGSLETIVALLLRTGLLINKNAESYNQQSRNLYYPTPHLKLLLQLRFGMLVHPVVFFAAIRKSSTCSPATLMRSPVSGSNNVEKQRSTGVCLQPVFSKRSNNTLVPFSRRTRQATESFRELEDTLFSRLNTKVLLAP